MTALALFLRLPDTTVDLTSWNHWRLPAVKYTTETPDDDFGPVLVTVEYQVAPEQVEEFLKAVRQYRRIRRRDGARGWATSTIWRMDIARSKPSSSRRGPNISANPNDSRRRISRPRSESNDVSYPSRKSSTWFR